MPEHEPTPGYTLPSYEASAFHCPHCGVLSDQKWCGVAEMRPGPPESYGKCIKGVSVSVCSNCRKYALWVDKEIAYPRSSAASLPVEDMPDDVKEDFKEAREIVDASPRAAAALLRLALQKLMVHLGEDGKNINKNIESLVERGLSEQIQRALDVVRVIGNNAVHPGKIDLSDDTETTLSLFKLLNIIVDDMITRPKEIGELFNQLPDSAREAIRERDSR